MIIAAVKTVCLWAACRFNAIFSGPGQHQGIGRHRKAAPERV